MNVPCQGESNLPRLQRRVIVRHFGGSVMKRRASGIAVILVVVGVGALARNASFFRAKYASSQLATASEGDRAALVEQLVKLDEIGRQELLGHLKRDDATLCESIVRALKRDPSSASLMLREFPQFGEAGQACVLASLPDLLNGADSEATAFAKVAVKSGLQSSTSVKVQAVKWAARPEIGELAAVVPLLSDADGVVRAAALTAVGTANDGPIGDEDLFKWMHDPLADVRHVCAAVLQARGRSLDEIEMGRRLTHPKSHERLELLLDLASDRDRDVGPWLERLSRDAVAAVRAGAVRVAYQRKLLDTTWADVLATADPDPTVRGIAKYHRDVVRR
jgi:hypothetical protein